jgi:sugar lactone lactonase YvrE
MQTYENIFILFWRIKMKIKITWLIAVFLFALGMLFVACEAPDQPVYDQDNPDPWPTGKDPAVLTSLSPQAGFVEDEVTISGSGFSANPGENVVSFGNKTATIISQSATELQVIAPEISGKTVKVSVAVSGSEFWSNKLDFVFGIAVEVIDDETDWPNGVAHDSDGNVYFGSAENGVIYKLTPDGDKSEFAEVPVNGSMHFASDGYLYVCEQGEGKIVRISPDGGTIEDVVEAESPIDFDWDSDGNMYIVANWDGIYKLDGTGALTMVAEFSSGKSIRIYESTLYLTEVWDERLWKFDITAGGLENQEAIIDYGGPLGVDVGIDGTVYYTDEDDKTIYKIDQDGTRIALFDDQLEDPLRFLSLNGIFMYAVYPGWNGTGQLWKVYVGQTEEAPRYGP